MSKHDEQTTALSNQQLCKTESESSTANLYAWTLTHRTPVFSNIHPSFSSEQDLLKQIQLRNPGAIKTPDVTRRTRETADRVTNKLENDIMKIALEKISDEWRAWTEVHSESRTEEERLDNMLMKILYRFILVRDGNKCVLCGSKKDLNIHHIIQKRRRFSPKPPPFGRSVPTNLVTLCRGCHSCFDPLGLNYQS